MLNVLEQCRHVFQPLLPVPRPVHCPLFIEREPPSRSAVHDNFQSDPRGAFIIRNPNHHGMPCPWLLIRPGQNAVLSCDDPQHPHVFGKLCHIISPCLPFHPVLRLKEPLPILIRSDRYKDSSQGLALNFHHLTIDWITSTYRMKIFAPTS